jgi:isopentenyl phosphate kinase
MKPLVFIKIGGSLISQKIGRKCIERKKLRRILSEIVEVIRLQPQFSFVICHGHGQMGHSRLMQHNAKSSLVSSQRVMELSMIMRAAIGMNPFEVHSSGLAPIPYGGIIPTL